MQYLKIWNRLGIKGVSIIILAIMTKKPSSELVSNRKAFHSYEILESFETGIALQGTEVKSLKEHGGSLQEAYVRIKDSELWLVGCSISPWRFGNIHNHEEIGRASCRERV